MKKRYALFTVILAVSILIGIQAIGVVDANPTMFGKTRYCHISIESPKNGTTLNTQPIALNFTVTEVKMASAYTFFYLLDTQDLQYGVRVQNLVLISKETVTNDTFFPYERQIFAGGAILPILASGSHNLTVFIGYAIADGTLKAANVEPFSSTISFNIDNKTVTPSQTTGISNDPYNQDDLPAYLVVAVPIIIAAVASVLLVYFKEKKGEAMKRRITVFTLVLAVSILIGIQAVELVGANPYGIIWPTDIPAPPSVKLDVKITSPIDGAVYANGTLDVCFNVTLIDPNSLADSLYMSFYKGDWMKDAVWCPFMVKSNVWHSTDFLPFNFSIIEVPYGHHSLEISPTAQGTFIRNGTAYHFSLNKTISVNFFIHSNPVIAFLTTQNTTSTNSTFPLNFTIDHSVQEITYQLDKKESTPIYGNSTLAGIPNGKHNLTVTATDEFGNTGNSDTLYFSVQAPEFPIITIAACTIALVVVFIATAFLFFKRHSLKPLSQKI